MVQSETDVVGDPTRVEREAEAGSERLGRCNVNKDFCFLENLGVMNFVGEGDDRSVDNGDIEDGDVNSGDISFSRDGTGMDRR